MVGACTVICAGGDAAENKACCVHGVHFGGGERGTMHAELASIAFNSHRHSWLQLNGSINSC
jgi:hypothetical protein